MSHVSTPTPLGVHRPVAGAVLPADGTRAFPIAGARVWNALPSDVTSAPSLAVFGRRLKTELFRPCNAV